ncbi:MAG: putative bifunctional diguanylate cyclase/phosphodiesterase [Mycolicibacterium sp.]|uniref:putative bifunctional diguanylate cyclase/phosphodiesterase n=1 Tax=Mycolicibacterium sp. TaxID=2320850 RepID=UPI003D0B12AD
MPNTRRMVVAAVAAGAGFSVLQLSTWSAHPVVRAVNDLFVLAIALAAGGCALAAARRVAGKRRAAWICMAIGCGGFAAGQLVWSYHGLVDGPFTFQSVADVGYVAMPVSSALALLFLWDAYPRATRMRAILDGTIVAGALFGAAWMALLGTVYSVEPRESLSVALTLAYPVADIALVTIALLLLVRVRPADRPMVAMLTAGLVLIGIADVAYAYVTAVKSQYYEAISIGYAWGFLAIAGAAMVTRRAPKEHVWERTHPPSPASIWVPFVPLVIGAAVSTPILVPELGPFYLVGVVTVVAVLARLLLMLTENRRLLTEVSDRALRDPLTGLANRALFTDRLNHALQLHRTDGLTVAVLLLDLDDFKLVNDSLGYGAGDALLMRVGERLTGAVRAVDTVARLDSDEFAVLIEGQEAESRVAAQRVLKAFERPFVVDDEEFLVRPSIGLAVAVPTGGLRGNPQDELGAKPAVNGEDGAVRVDELLRRADVAMQAAKRSRSGQLVTFAPALDLHRGDKSEPPTGDIEVQVAGRRGSARLLGELRHAIEHGGLSAVYQPKVDVRTRRIVGVEALVRWPHPRHGLLAPDQFLPLVREHGLMHPVTSVMLNLALDDAAQWRARGVGIPVAVNVAAPSISDADLPRQIIDALEVRGLPPEILTVEITEDLLLENMEGTRAAFTMLRDCRIRTAIDDFGTGYSALWYLRDFPVHEVKLDRQFIAPILTQPTSAAIVRAVIDLAHVLGVTPVAEGVENAETADRLLEYGCDVAQGFYYSRPVPAAAILDLLQSQARAQMGGGGEEQPDSAGYPPAGTRRSEIELMQ